MSATSRLRSIRYWAPLALALPLAIWGFSRPSSVGGAAPPSTDDRVARGEYLVTAIGCGDCHTPKVFGPDGPVPDQSRLLSGHPEGTILDPVPALGGSWAAAAAPDLTAWAGPWGVSFPFNLTPDENTGIGSWSEETFVQALRTGRHMGVSRPILPPMPWQQYRNLSDRDLRSIYAYLRSIPPVRNRVPQPIPPESVSAAATGR